MTISKGELSNHVCSLEWARKLREVGVPQESEFYWITWVDGDTTLHNYSGENQELVKDFYSAFLSSELGEMLPKDISTFKRISLDGNRTLKGWTCRRYDYKKKGNLLSEYDTTDFEAYTEANARTKMLIYLIDNKLLPIPGRE